MGGAPCAAVIIRKVRELQESANALLERVADIAEHDETIDNSRVQAAEAAMNDAAAQVDEALTQLNG